MTVQVLPAQLARVGLLARRGHVRDRHVAQLVRVPPRALPAPSAEFVLVDDPRGRGQGEAE